MDTKIFLQGFDSKVSSNTSEGLNVQFKGRRKLLPLNDVADVISQYDQYKEEREACNIIRLTCQVNPICSNVLFNRITEIVKNEGSSGVTFINYAVYGSDESGRSYEDNQTELFSGVTYKPNVDSSSPKPMEFWSGGSMNYQGFDWTRENLDSTITIFGAINAYKKFDPNMQLQENNGYNHPTNSIRDTQLSNKTSDFIYHCGIDIMNNHLIRSNTFKTICKLPDSDYDPYNHTEEYHGFNTIADLMRDVQGNKVIEKVCFPVTAPVDNHARIIALHLYEYDDLDIFKTAVQKKIVKKHNGWVGFENNSKIKSYIDFSGNTELEIERPIMYMNGGDFVDMYPGRDLYSFVPKYNTHRKRIEKNWNYCITYPSSSYTPSTSADPFTEIIDYNVGALKAVYFNENTRSDNGTTQLVIYSASKHGLAQGDYVNVYKTYTTKKYWVVDTQGNRVSEKYNTEREAKDELDRLIKEGKLAMDCGESDIIEAKTTACTDNEETYTEKVIDNGEVAEIVDDYIFTLFNTGKQISKQWLKLTKKQLRAVEDLVVPGDPTRTLKTDQVTKKFLKNQNDDDETIYYIVNDEYVNVDLTAQNISYKKVVNDIECEYYIRIFSKLPNFKFASGDTSSEYELYKDNEKIIHEYQEEKYDFENHISRLAFAKNIYTDEVGEVVFTDDIDIANIHDNLGRPLTSLYLTFIKNNQGYKEWYGYDYSGATPWEETDISGETVEYSHAFGKVTCGIETSFEANYGEAINCINRITNVVGFNTPSGFIIDGVLNDKDPDDEDDYRTYQITGGTKAIDDEKTVKIERNEIWYHTDKHFYGDLCYYDAYNAIERHISYVMHRFNTAQRESVGSDSSSGENGITPYYKHYTYDEIRYDDYDSSEEFEIVPYKNEYDCDNKEEGYYYIPHYEIPIKTFDKLQTIMPDFLTIREMKRKSSMGDNVYQFTTLEQHFLGVGDKAILFDRLQDKYYDLVTISGDSDNYRVFTCLVYDEESGSGTAINYLDGKDDSHDIDILSSKSKISSLELDDFNLFKMDNLDCPSYARVLKDGTCRVIWRDVLNNGFNKSDDSVEEYPYTNGAFYVNKRVDIYVRRQDPHDEYWLYHEDDIEGVVIDIAEEDNYTKEADIEC